MSRALLARLIRFTSALSTLTAIAAGMALLTLGVIAFLGVAGRVLHFSVAGADEVAGYLLGVVMMWGAASAFRHGTLVRLEFAYERLVHSRWAHPAEVVMHAMAVVYAVLVVAALIQLTAESLTFQALSIGLLAVPLWLPQAAFAIGAASFVLYLGAALSILLLGRAAPRRRDISTERQS